MEHIEDIIPTTAYFRQRAAVLHAKLQDERNYPADHSMPEEKLMFTISEPVLKEWYLSWLHLMPEPSTTMQDAVKQYVMAQHPMRIWRSIEMYQDSRMRQVEVGARCQVRHPDVLTDQAALKHTRRISDCLAEVLRQMGLYQQNGERDYALRSGELWVGVPVKENGRWIVGDWQPTGHTLRAVQERLAVAVLELEEQPMN